MTREEQIINAANEYTKDPLFKGARMERIGAFVDGAEWADANRWVKVEDGLPETTNLCIVCTNEEEFDLDRFTDSYGDSSGPHACFTRRNVTHWQYVTLPSPPKAEQ